MTDSDTWLERVGDTMVDIKNYSANLVVNSARSLTIGHEYIIEENDLSSKIPQNEREVLAFYSNEILEFYKEMPDATDPHLRQSIDNISDTTSTIGMYTGGGLGLAGGVVVTTAVAPAGPVVMAGGVVAGTAMTVGGAAAGQCTGAAAGAATEIVVNMGFESPRGLTRDMLVADINAAIEAEISSESIVQRLDQQLESHRNSFSNGELVKDRSFSQYSLINNAFIDAGVEVPRHESSWLGDFREKSGAESTYVLVPISSKESFDGHSWDVPCDFNP